MMMVVLLACGGQAVMTVGSWLNVNLLLTQAATGHEEEEERHSGKGTTATSGRRVSPSVSCPQAPCQRPAHCRATSQRPPALAHTPAHRDADLRNGIGTAMRC
jgi:hypothetical protein